MRKFVSTALCFNHFTIHRDQVTVYQISVIQGPTLRYTDNQRGLAHYLGKEIPHFATVHDVLEIINIRSISISYLWTLPPYNYLPVVLLPKGRLC